MTQRTSRKSYVLVYIALLILLALTIVADQFALGLFNTVIAISIAAIKMLLIMLFFMHVRSSGRLTWIVAGAGLFWLSILFGLTLTDLLTRSWLATPGT
jgi:cytochrome c oxidase subunit IV